MVDTEESPQDATTTTTTTTTSMLAICKCHLDEEEWNYEVNHVDDNRSYITCGVKGVNGSYKVVLDVKEESQILIIYVISHISFPSSNLVDVAHFLTRANYGLPLGNFELDMSDGEVRYKCSTVVAGGTLAKESVNTMLQASLVTMDRYYDNLVKVAYGVLGVEDAYSQCEQGTSDRIAGVLRAIQGQVEEETSPTGEESSPLPFFVRHLSGLLEARTSISGEAVTGDEDNGTISQ